MVVPDYKCYAMRKSDSGILAFSLFIAILGAVTAVVLLGIGEEDAPEGSELWIIAGGIAVAIGVLAAVAVYYTARIGVTIHSEGTKLYVEVADPKFPDPLRVHYPFTARMQHTEHYVTHRKRIKKLFYTLRDENDYPQLTFCLELGSLYDAPYGSEFIDYRIPGENEKLKIADRIYDSGKTEDIQIELGGRLKYIERTLARESQT